MQLTAAAARALGHEVVLCSSGGGTDGNIYNAAGIACVVISTGMEDVHTPSERIAVADMVGGTELLMAVVRRLAAE